MLLEAAHFDPAVIARAARRHKLPSEASRRFERTVDPPLPPVAAERAAQLLVELGGGTIAAGRTDVGAAPAGRRADAAGPARPGRRRRLPAGGHRARG